LEFLVPTEAVFTLKYQDTPLPAGIAVALTSPDQRLSNLPAGVTQAGGQILGPNVRALWPTGPLAVKAEVAGFASEPTAEFAVFVLESAIGFQFNLDPALNSNGQETPDLSGGYTASCRTFDITINLTYQGYVAASVPTVVAGFQYSHSGQTVLTSATGQVSGSIFYSREHLPAYNGDSTYSITFGSTTAKRQGPIPLDFKSCQP
jgi:hypothetical protein